MNALKNNLHNLDKVRNLVKDEQYFKHTSIDNMVIDNDTISIIMTSHNRSKQVYFTLKTISTSSFKSIHVILVDDSDSDKVDVEKLKEYPFYIDFIEIDKSKKCWHNPVVNYNIGFEYVKGSKIVIQNSEVCHIGDVLNYVDKNLKNEYFVFDVKASRHFNENDIIYESELFVSIFDKDLFSLWYQHHSENNRQLHFLTAMSLDLFKKVKGFSFDYSFGSWYDDDDFLLKIKTFAPIKSIPNEIEKVGGIHLYHQLAVHTWDRNELNDILFELKRSFVSKYGYYLEISEQDDKENAYQKLKLN